MSMLALSEPHTLYGTLCPELPKCCLMPPYRDACQCHVIVAVLSMVAVLPTIFGMLSRDNSMYLTLLDPCWCNLEHALCAAAVLTETGFYHFHPMYTPHKSVCAPSYL